MEEQRRYIPIVVQGKRHQEIFHVDDKYSDLKIIGSGSYGVVCSAFDNRAKVKVAIKKVTNALEDLVDAGRVLRELRLLRHIDGRENTLKILDTYTYPPDTHNFEDVYIVTDLMETDMDRVLRSSQGLSTQHFGYFLYQLLRSVANMHHASVLHRDLKPSNLLVNANCDLVVCDFGLARGVSHTTKQPPNTARADGRREPSIGVEDGDTDDFLTEYVVTRWYRPPEILAESPYYGAAADVWSVGCIFGEMLDKRRKPIFRGSNPQNQMKLIISALGCPTDAELDFCTSTSSRGVIRRVCNRVKDEGCAPWDFKERFPGADPQALDLLQKMLIFDPQKRITADEALNHPFLQEVHSHWHKMEKINKFDFSFEKVHHESNRERIIPRKHLQNLFLYEVNKYRHVYCRISTPLHLKKAAATGPSRRKSISSHGAQVLTIDHRSKSNQQLEMLEDKMSKLPAIDGSKSKINKTEKSKEPKQKKETKGRIIVSRKSGISDNAVKFFRKVQPATVVPSTVVQKDKLSQSLRPVDSKDKIKGKMLSRNKKKSVSSSAILRRQSSGTSNSSTSLIRRASRKLFD